MTKTIMRQLYKYLRKYRALLIFALAAAIISVPLGLLSPVLIGRAVDIIASRDGIDFAALAHTLMLLALTAAISAILTWAMNLLARKASARAAQDLRTEAFEQINRAPFSLLDTKRHGDIVSRLVNDTDAVSEGLLQTISQLVPGIVTVITTIVLMCMLNIWIALAVIVVTPLSIFFARFIGLRTNKHFLRQSQAQGKISAFASEMVGNQPLITALGYQDQSATEFAALADDYYDANFKATLYSSVVNPGTRFVNAIVYGAVGVFGAMYAIAGGISIGSLSAFLAYANQYTRPFNEITAVLTQMQAAIASAERIFEIIHWESDSPDDIDAKAPAHSDGHVQARNVYFSYNRKKPLIQDFSLDAKPGMRIAVVGPTGCGKTTLINLLMRFYDVDSGKILVDNTPITRIRRDNLRSLYGMVLQDTWLKHATIRENIAYAHPDAAMDDVIAAAKSAMIHNFVLQLPQGYDTMVENGGENFSAGQRQLLCIARIMLAKPDMLILDEATSSIDTRTELTIQRALERLMHGRTSFIVAHRLSTVRGADLILVMNLGQIVERGTHEELIKYGGVYASMYRRGGDDD